MTAAMAKKGVVGLSEQLLPTDRRGRNVLNTALRYACMAHDHDLVDLRTELEKLIPNDPDRLVDLVVVLGALVDVDRTPSQLLAWMCPPGQQPKPRRGTELCGTLNGHMLHVQTDEEPCRPCQAAFDRETAPVRALDKLSPCPSPGGYSRHKRLGEEVCDGCRVAMRAYWRNEYETKKRLPEIPRRGKSKCGERSGYEQHKRKGEEPCVACRAGNRTYYRDWARKKRGRACTKSEANALRQKPCGELAARRRHCRKRERCDTCWPDPRRTPSWYPPLSPTVVRRPEPTRPVQEAVT